MKITAIKPVRLFCKCNPIADALSTSTGRQALLIKIETDTDLYGIGEAFSYGAPLDAMSIILEKQIAPALIGEDPTNIEKLWNTMYWRTIANGRRSLTMGVISGIDIALWDLLGKTCHMNIAGLLGQCYDKIPSYASGGFYAEGKDVDALKKEIEGYVKKGYKDVKIKIGRTMDRAGAPLSYMANQKWAVSQEEDYERVRAAKSIIGSGLLAVDTNASWDSYTTLDHGRILADIGVKWIEEPIPFEDIDGYKRISKELTELSIIGCETMQGASNFETMVREDALDILQPDIGWCGGITEIRKIGALAKMTGHKISLHCFGSAVLFAASLQMAAAMENTERIESEENPNPLKTDIIKEPFDTDDNMSFIVPDGYGLGIDLDWNKIEALSL